MTGTASITLPASLVSACADYGHMKVRSYRIGMYSNAFSSRGAEGNPVLWAESRMGECAAALWAGLDPLRVLDWSMFADHGFDFVAYGQRLDVKTTGPGRRYLIWPTLKRRLYAGKAFDVLVLARGARPRFELVGWIPKSRFTALRQEAPPGHRFDVGTWFVPAAALWPMETLQWGW